MLERLEARPRVMRHEEEEKAKEMQRSTDVQLCVLTFAKF